MALESSRRELQLWFRLCPDSSSRKGVISVQSLKSLNQDSFGTPFWESREKEPFGCRCGGESQRMLYGGRWWLPPSPGHGESSESKCPWLVPTPKGVPECELTLLWLVLDVDSSAIILVPLPSLILGLLARPSTPFSAGSWEQPSSPNFPQFNVLGPSSGSSKGLGSSSCAEH
jgi:hypothetical protein